MVNPRLIGDPYIRDYCRRAHAWGDTVECDECGDDRCGVICIDCPYVSYWCKEER